MKLTLTTICAIVLIMAGLCAYSSSALNESVAHMQSLCDQLERATEASDAQAAADAAQALWQDWRELMPKLAALIPHEDLDNVSLSATHLWRLARQRNFAGLLLASDELSEHLDHLLHKEELSWENLL